MWGLLLNLLFEERCLGCRKVGDPLCSVCIQTIEPADSQEYAHIESIYSYQHPLMRRAVHRMKYKNRKILADSLGIACAERTLEMISEKRILWGMSGNEKILVIPVPLSFRRLRTRGFNQAESIAAGFCKASGDSFLLAQNILEKIRETDSQVSVKDRTSRLTNLRGAFRVKEPHRIKGKCIILIDDVTTTGATLHECRMTLLEAGAREVFCITVAH